MKFNELNQAPTGVARRENDSPERVLERMEAEINEFFLRSTGNFGRVPCPASGGFLELSQRFGEQLAQRYEAYLVQIDGLVIIFYNEPVYYLVLDQ